MIVASLRMVKVGPGGDTNPILPGKYAPSEIDKRGE